MAGLVNQYLRLLFRELFLAVLSPVKLNAEFSKKFSSAASKCVATCFSWCTWHIYEGDKSIANSLLFNCSQRDVVYALQSCANTAAGPDGVNFSTIEIRAPSILLPLQIIFQQSLTQGKFPSSWKMCWHFSLI